MKYCLQAADLLQAFILLAAMILLEGVNIMLQMPKVCLALLALGLGSPVWAGSCLDAVRQADISNKLVTLKNSYGDVPSGLACHQPKSKAETLICAQDKLKSMALLDAQAYVYALENATGTEADHQRDQDTDWIKQVRNQCADAECLCRAYKAHTNDSLGGESPYYR